MNQNIATTAWLPPGKRNRAPNDAVRREGGILLPPQTIDKQLVWSGSYAEEWEILVYRKGDVWEACFFRWEIHHEHIIGSSFGTIYRRAEERISSLEAGGLKATNWELIMH